MGKWYDADTTLSKQRLFNFVVGPRGCGKTYSAKRRAIKNFLKDGSQFVYLRRYETEMPAAQMRNFFDDIGEKFIDHDFKSHNGLFRIDNEIAGWYFPLSKAVMLKSIPFPKVSLIIFDEFIIDVGVYHYLPKEVTTFLECYSTISRDRDIPVLFLSNAITFTNPYFLYFNITLENGQTSKLMGDISIEVVQNDEYIDHAKSTRFGKLVANTEYGSYAMENKFLRDNDVFIQKMGANCTYIATIIVEGQNIGMYRDFNTPLIYLSEKVDSTCMQKLTIETESHNSSTIFARRGNIILKALLDSFSEGNVRFETMKVKNLIYNLLRRMI